jgi:hypothetical protein
MIFDAATSETIVDSPDAKNDAVLVRRHPAGRVRCNMRNKQSSATIVATPN